MSEPPGTGRLHTLLWNAGPLVVSRYTSAVLGLVTTVVATRWLGVERFGEASLAAAYPLLLWSVTSVKSVSITTRYLASFRAAGDTTSVSAIVRFGFLLDAGMATGALAIVLLTGQLVATHVYHMPETYGLMVLLASSFPVYSLGGTNEAILTAYSRFGAIAFLLVFESLLRLGLVAAAWLLDGGTTAYILATAASQIVIGTIGMGVASKTLSADGSSGWWRGGVHFATISPIKSELRQFFGWNYALVTFSGFVDQLPAMLLGAHRGPSAVAFYRLATSLMVTVGYVEASLRRAIYPSLLADWNSGGLSRLRADIGPMTWRIGIPAGAAIVAAAVLFVPAAVRLLFGDGYEPMILGAQLMIAAAGASMAAFWLHPYYFAAGRVVLWSKLYVTYSCAFLAVAWVVSDLWGFLGIASLIAVGKASLALAGVLTTRSATFSRE